VPIVLDFGKWLYSEDDELAASFTTDQNLEYSISFRGNGTRFSIPFVGTWWLNASIYVDGTKAGEEIIDSEVMLVKIFPRITLTPGLHTINVKLTNDKFIPFVGDTNLYVESVTLSE
jgi:hypothetical protein